MQLLTLRSEEETDQIYELAEKYKPMDAFWVSASDFGHEGDFVWTTTGLKMTNARWHETQPDNGGGREHCVEITYLWNDTVPSWNDLRCYNENSFFCEAVHSLLDPCL